MNGFRIPRDAGFFARFVVLIIAVFLFAGYVGERVLGRAPNILTPEETKTSGASGAASASALYLQNCARCHGADGKGDTAMGRALSAPDFTDNDWRKNRSAKEMTSTVTRGNKGMPAFGKKLTKREITSLVSYVRRLK